ncbi:hypothetical protein POSPLADRAFT_1059016 [Postia placenta MAD-698-R-SB12]|uniref:AB hydrolase-1 domain-containing protein n=1 Tax=Postia placenta MAD-698-R-SB12 TaxID=670580 RepID=A0A1X6MTM3_9APHY|nr:hypothetical protein POSPLADRAFT_1059016 [Postia placenta MAD-698-R-SB12]OSX59718.1 hypothetical protein POSPLADRAFT_1059016 [Postia placenta MAD-698-R-SB12]
MKGPEGYELLPQSYTGSHWRDEEKILTLQHGRTLAYTSVGDPDSQTVILSFHGGMSIGFVRTQDLAPTLVAKKVHFVALTLPGWGSTSSPRGQTSYASCVISDVVALLNHLYSDTTKLRIYVAGLVFGAFAAQILYHAPFDQFPLGRQIVAMFLRHPCSPKQYNLVEPSAVVTTSAPRAVFWYLELLMRFRLRSVDSAEHWIRKGSSKLSAAHKEKYVRWLADRGYTEAEYTRDLAERTVYSVSKTWQGLRMTREVMKWEWGTFDPASLDKEHASRPILIVSPRGSRMTQFLVESYKNVQAVYCNTVLDMSMWNSDGFWSKLLDNTE